MRNEMVYIDGYSFNDVLGPHGESCVSVWFHGCHRHCKGCIAANWNNSNEAKLSVSADFLASMIAEEAAEKQVNIDAVVISGGEPFLQTAGVEAFLSFLSAELGHFPGVMIYTGYTLEELKLLSETSPCISDLLDITDILVDGEYIEELDFNEPYAGSKNQKIHFLSDRYSAKDLPEKERITSILFPDEAEFMMVGIPSSEAKMVWEEIENALAP